MSDAVIIKDEFGQEYRYVESRFNVDIPLRHISIPPESIIIFHNVRIGEKGLSDQIPNDDTSRLELSHAELIERIKLSNVSSIEIELDRTIKRSAKKFVTTDTSHMTYTNWLVILGIVAVLIVIYFLSTI